jgi:hypothetical protein
MTPLHEFKIQSGAEIGSCSNMGSFRAVRLKDSLPVLLHRFRPAEIFSPAITDTHIPDFHVPFATKFIASFKTTGSLYLVEPLPVCISLSDAWRSMLINSPECAQDFIEALIEQLLRILFPLNDKGEKHGGVCIENIVLTQNSSYGLLTNKLITQDGFILLRHATYTHYYGDFAAIGQILKELLNIEALISLSHKKPIIHYKIRSKVELLALTFQDNEVISDVYSIS